MDWLREFERTGAAEVVRDMLPAKPPRLLTVTLEESEVPNPMVRTVGLAEIVKSTTSTVKVAEWDNDPLFPVTVTVKIPGENLAKSFNVAVTPPPPESVTLDGLKDNVGPVGGAVAVRLTLPAKPPSPCTLTEDEPAEPMGISTKVGFAEIAKSTTLTLTVD